MLVEKIKSQRMSRICVCNNLNGSEGIHAKIIITKIRPVLHQPSSQTLELRRIFHSDPFYSETKRTLGFTPPTTTKYNSPYQDNLSSNRQSLVVVDDNERWERRYVVRQLRRTTWSWVSFVIVRGGEEDFVVAPPNSPPHHPSHSPFLPNSAHCRDLYFNVVVCMVASSTFTVILRLFLFTTYFHRCNCCDKVSHSFSDEVRLKIISASRL